MNSISLDTVDLRNSVSADSSDSSAGARRASTKASRAVWTGRALGAVGVLFLAMDAAMKLFVIPATVEVTTLLGYSASVIVPLGILEVVLLALYLIPRTSLLGAILWTGYLGGAVATHVRVENPLFSHILFPVYIATFLWASLCLRDERVARALGLGAR